MLCQRQKSEQAAYTDQEKRIAEANRFTKPAAENRPHIGEKIARLMKLQPKTIPDQRAISAGLSTPSSAI